MDNQIEQKQNCPLCHRPATYQMRKLGRAKIFSCPHCLSFALYTDAEESLSKIKEHYRQNYSQNAKETASDQIFVIDIQFALADIINTSQGPVPVQFATVCPYREPRNNWL
jgi:transposase-like protein